MPKTKGFYSNENKRERALKIIEAAKLKGRTNTKAVQGALETLNQLDPVAHIHDLAHSHKVVECDTTKPVHMQNRHTNVSGAAYTIGGQIVPITQPPLPEDHDAALGWHEPDAPPENPFKEVAETLERIVSWLAEGRTAQRVGLRGIALVTVLRPASFQDRCTGSLSSIAKLFGLSRQEVQRFTRELRELTADRRWVGHNQRYLGREKNRACAVAYHVRVGHKIKEQAPCH